MSRTWTGRVAVAAGCWAALTGFLALSRLNAEEPDAPVAAESPPAGEAPAEAPAVDAESGKARLQSCEYYPLKVGAQWTYSAGPIEIIERVAAHEPVEGELCARIDTLYNGKVVAYEHITVREDGVFRVAIAGRPVVPPLCFLKLPATPGDTWKIESSILEQSITGSLTTGSEEISIRNRKIEVITTAGQDFQAGKSKLAFSYYFAKNIGKVRQRIVADDDETILDLVQYRDGPPPTAAVGEIRDQRR